MMRQPQGMTRHAPTYRGSMLLVAGLALLVSTACTTKHFGEDGLLAFEVRITSPAGTLGTEAEPLPFVSGQLCTPDVPACPADQSCVHYCNESELPCAADDDCPGQYELCLGACVTSTRITVEAIGNFGVRVPFTGFLTVSAIPGFVPPPARTVRIEDGVAEDVEIFFARGTGPTLLWVEDSGYKPRVGAYGECNDGKDNDRNGVTDLADAGCDSETDAVEHAITGVAGVTDRALIFENPLIRHLQFTSAVATSSPLQGQDVRIDQGRFIVTNVTSSGMFVTDLDDQVEVRPDGSPGYYNSIFLYTWSTPDNVSYGDKLCWFSGGAVEHEGNTQIAFPTFWTYFDNPDDPECTINLRLDPKAKVPEPVDVTERLKLEDPAADDYALSVYENAVALEPFENGLIKVDDVILSTRFLACDANANGDIDYDGDEDTCRTVCQEDPTCTQLEGFFEYKQYAAFVAGKKKLAVSGEMLQEFAPLRIEYLGQPDRNERCTLGAVWLGDTRFLEYRCPERRLVSATGNLRHLFLCPKTWEESRCELQFHTIVPRFDEDMVEEKGETP